MKRSYISNIDRGGSISNLTHLHFQGEVTLALLKRCAPAQLRLYGNMQLSSLVHFVCLCTIHGMPKFHPSKGSEITNAVTTTEVNTFDKGVSLRVSQVSAEYSGFNP